MRLFPRNSQHRAKTTDLKVELTQIDHGGSNGSIFSEICTYGVGQLVKNRPGPRGEQLSKNFPREPKKKAMRTRLLSIFGFLRVEYPCGLSLDWSWLLLSRKIRENDAEGPPWVTSILAFCRGFVGFDHSEWMPKCVNLAHCGCRSTGMWHKFPEILYLLFATQPQRFEVKIIMKSENLNLWISVKCIQSNMGIWLKILQYLDRQLNSPFKPTFENVYRMCLVVRGFVRTA